MSERIGFFDEKENCRSSTRLILILLAVMACSTILTINIVALTKDKPETILAALTLALGTELGGIWSALDQKRRNDAVQVPS